MGAKTNDQAGIVELDHLGGEPALDALVFERWDERTSAILMVLVESES